MSYLAPDLNECDREQIQYIESIQPFGALIVVDGDKIIRYASCPPGFSLNATELVGKNLKELFGEDTERIFLAAKGRQEPTTPFLIRNKRWDRWITGIAHQQGNLNILEFELVPTKSADIPSVKFMSKRMETLDSYLSYIAESVQSVTGYDRVMIYKFANDWHGEVVAEALVGDAFPFYGHHFPASDIPVPARDLFTKIWVRMIADVNAEPIPIVGKSAEKLDLTKSILRASSSIHMDYLRNMGVAASLTLSLICDGKLWGLVACHHFTPKYLSAEQRSVCSLIAKSVSARITSLSVTELIAAGNRVFEFTSEIGASLTAGKLQETVRTYKHNLYEFVKCDGFSFISSQPTVVEGHAPTMEESRQLAAVLRQTDANVVYTESIAKTFPELGNLQAVAAGILAIRVGSDWCVWNKQEIVRSVLWAGDPNKPVYSNDKFEKLSPRSSFESWRQYVRGTSSPWQQYEIEACEKLRMLLLESIGSRLDQQEPFRADANQYMRMLRASINNQAADLQSQFKELKLDDSIFLDS